MTHSTRAGIARMLLWFATVWWGTWFGGQLFNAWMVVPYFSASPPASLREWGRLRFAYVADFFVIFNSLWILLALALALVVGRRVLGRAGGWTLASAVAALVSVVFVFAWMVPTISRLVSADSGGLALGAMRSQLRAWKEANGIRIAVELVGFLSALRALSCRWAPESPA